MQRGPGGELSGYDIKTIGLLPSEIIATWMLCTCSQEGTNVQFKCIYGN